MPGVEVICTDRSWVVLVKLQAGFQIQAWGYRVLLTIEMHRWWYHLYV